MSKFLTLILTCSFLLMPAAVASARDRDHDGLRDRWERKHNLSVHKKSGKRDPDRDRLNNRREFKHRTNPHRRDTDRDGLRDGAEVRRYKTNPRRRDTDRDGLRDRAEIKRYKTNPRRRDTDRDGYSDRAEIRAGTNPRDPRSHPGAASAPTSVAPAAPSGRPGPPPDPGPRPVVLSCSRTATTATFNAQVAAAGAGETVCLASGDYGSWGGTNKPIVVGPAPGAAVSMGISFGSGDTGFTLIGVTSRGGTVTAGAHDFVVRDTVFTGVVRFDGLAGANVLFDHNSHNNINGDQSSSPARIHLSYSSGTPSGVTIANSLLAGGDTDGVQSGVGVNVVNNEFRDIKEAGGTNHTDNVQLLGAAGSIIRGNWVHTSGGTTQGIAAYDGLRSSLIEQNVVDIPRAWGIEVYADQGSTIRHNTLPYRGSRLLRRVAVRHDRPEPEGAGPGRQRHRRGGQRGDRRHRDERLERRRAPPQPAAPERRRR